LPILLDSTQPEEAMPTFDLVFQWHLEPVDGGTRISVHVDIPEREAARLDMQRDFIKSSLRNLGTLAAAD
jgi:hypothetical protein